MRLYKNVKIELKVTINIIAKQIDIDPITIKKYNGKIEKINDYAGFWPHLFERLCNSTLKERLYRYIEHYSNIKVDNIELVPFTTKMKELDYKELNRTNAEVTNEYVCNPVYKLVLTIYGKLFSGDDDKFEENFKTSDDLYLTDIFNDEQLNKIIYETITKEYSEESKKKLNVFVHAQMDDEVRMVGEY